MLVDQICEASGGPCKYAGRSMKAAHAGMKITAGVFDVDARGAGSLRVPALGGIQKVDVFAVTLEPAGGLPAPELFPVAAIAQAYADVFAEEGPAALQYSTTEGWRPLRDWIARRMQLRGVRNPDASRASRPCRR